MDRGVAACHGRLVYSGTADPKAAATLEQVGTAAADVRTYQHINKVRFSITKPTAIYQALQPYYLFGVCDHKQYIYILYLSTYNIPLQFYSIPMHNES